ncbi:efflux RND transporter permease subunit [Marinobacter zhejiangensis]|uniref:Multidrug efflux pump subunit AcrB n=1 Tax=Marinobacter zhejiangensis TaxID=488535 RepID=A0A1I4NCC2_9GAMM|nr:efflux RND transporter permease subunit [Marinobacter zhejiangensis]SFM13174.1 Multidrug efflux pump subunit AcrB [Marinobacter zhejiangensis]
MNIAEWSIKNRVITWAVTLVLVLVGYYSFNNLSRLEDPEFTIKEAKVITPYPGATAEEVEQEVSDLIERAAQKMGQLFYVESHSYRDRSIVSVKILDQFDKDALPQVWDELRRKVGDVQADLPPGAGPSIVVDDFGDVYGVYLAITGEGYTENEVYEFAKFLKRELLQVEDVKSIALYGEPEQVIYVEPRREKIAALGISPQDIARALGEKNTVAYGGYARADDARLAIKVSGGITSIDQFSTLLITSSSNPDQHILLGDIATITRGLTETPSNLLRFDGQPAIGLAIATRSGGNVVIMGDGLYAKLDELRPQIPLGMELNVVSMQSDAVTEAIRGFTVSLLQAIGIVVAVLLVFMGLRSGLIIGAVLLVTIMGTFIFMDIMDITLERISLGALIIALGMLVDNAIVVTDGIRMKLQQGIDSITAAKDVVSQTALPLLGATAIAVTAFAAIGTSQDSTGEYTRSLFTVILVSLSLSWFTAVTITPLLCHEFLKVASSGGNDAYSSGFYQTYRSLLTKAIRYRWLSLGVTGVVFLSAVFGFGWVKNSFFPDSTRPQFYVDVWYPQDSDISTTLENIKEIETRLAGYDNVTHVTTQVGGGSPRFLLTYTPEQPGLNFARLLVDVDDYRILGDITHKVQADLEILQPGTIINTRQFVLGPATGGKIQLRISGPDPDELRRLAASAAEVIGNHPNVKGFRDEWGERVQVIEPVLADAQAQKLGLDRSDIANAMAFSVDGVRAGIYREGDELIPIIARSPLNERRSLENYDQAPIWSPVAQKMVPMGQAVAHFQVGFEDPHIWRQDRVTMLRLHFDQRNGLSSELLSDIKVDVEKALNADLSTYLERHGGGSIEHTANTIPIRYRDRIPIKDMPGYYFAWGGENEDSVKAATSIAQAIPAFFGLMVFIVLALFNSVYKTLVIWLVVPLAIIGVTIGLLMFNQPFGFMALLGFMSLAGMLIKNAIVLVDQIDVELEAGRPPVTAVVESGVSRLIPVAMAALTTILGMLPLLSDAFFVAMAVTIMFGLGFATVLTLVVVPVLYATIFRFRSE